MFVELQIFAMEILPLYFFLQKFPVLIFPSLNFYIFTGLLIILCSRQFELLDIK